MQHNIPSHVQVEAVCEVCSKTQVVRAETEGYMNWRKGVVIQKALPTLTDDERELLLSGLCSKCFKHKAEELNEMSA